LLPAEPVRRPKTRHRPEAELRRSCLTSGSQDPNRINEPDRVSSMHLCTARRIGLSTRQKSERLCRRGTTESIRRAERAGGSATQHKREPTQRELHSGRTKPKRPPLGETAHLGSAVVDRTTMAGGLAPTTARAARRANLSEEPPKLRLRLAESGRWPRYLELPNHCFSSKSQIGSIFRAIKLKRL
jgi:hypothetical protein